MLQVTSYGLRVNNVLPLLEFIGLLEFVELLGSR